MNYFNERYYESILHFISFDLKMKNYSKYFVTHHLFQFFQFLLKIFKLSNPQFSFNEFYHYL